MATMVAEGFIGGSGFVKKYGGVAIHPKLHHGIAKDFKQTDHLNIDHDGRRRVAVRVLDTDVRPTKDGSLGVWVRFEVDEKEWRKVGGRMGLSVAVVEPVLRADPGSAKPTVSINYEAGQFDDATVEEAVAALRPYANVATRRIYQFSEELNLAKVAADFLFVTLQSVGAAAIYDALKVFLRPNANGKPARIVFDFKVREEKSERKHTRVVSAHLETDNPEDLRHALASLGTAFEGSGNVIGFDSDRREGRKFAKQRRRRSPKGMTRAESPRSTPAAGSFFAQFPLTGHRGRSARRIASRGTPRRTQSVSR